MESVQRGMEGAWRFAQRGHEGDTKGHGQVQRGHEGLDTPSNH